MSDEPRIPLRVVLTNLPPEGFEDFEGYHAVEAGVQRKDEVEPGEDFGDGALAFSLTLLVKKDPKSGRPNFLGEHAFGTPQERFLYLCWCGDKDGQRRSFRRMKIPLKPIDWRQVEAVALAEDKVLQCTVSARGRDGGPACASVPLMGAGWQIVDA